MRKNIVAVVLGGVVLFAWGFVSWAILPWHSMVANKFNDESAVREVLKQNASSAGIYFLPFAEEDFKPGETSAFLNVVPDGFEGDMGKMMGMSFFGQLVSTVLMLLLLSRTTRDDF